jgi:hypothetical protein
MEWRWQLVRIPPPAPLYCMSRLNFASPWKYLFVKKIVTYHRATTKLGVARPNPTINAVHSSVADFKVTSLCIRYIVAVNNAIMWRVILQWLFLYYRRRSKGLRSKLRSIACIFLVLKSINYSAACFWSFLMLPMHSGIDRVNIV